MTMEMTLARRIALARKIAGLTQEQLGELVGSPKESISEWERGLREPRVGVLSRIADATGFTLDQLVCGDLERLDRGARGLTPAEKENLSVLLNEAATLIKLAVQRVVAGEAAFDTLVDALASIHNATRLMGEPAKQDND